MPNLKQQENTPISSIFVSFFLQSARLIGGAESRPKQLVCFYDQYILVINMVFVCSGFWGFKMVKVGGLAFKKSFAID